jgi:8-oxo-dGTP diphosphatase
VIEQTSPPLLVAAAVLIDAGGRMLVQQRPHGKSLGGLWEFPGGKLEPRETPEAALVRELHEELGIIVLPQQLAPATFASAALPHAHLVMLIYLCRQWQGTPVPLHAAALRWILPHEFDGLPMPPADIPILPAIMTLIAATP